MVSNAEEIIKAVDNVEQKNIGSLLQKYEQPEKDFIQKYVETKIAIVGVDAFLFTIITGIMSIILFAFSIYFDKYNTISVCGFLYWFLLLILVSLYLLFGYPFIIKLIKNDVYEKIIIEIEVSNMKSNMKTKQTVISYDEINSKIDEINKKIKALEKEMNDKIETNGKDIMSLKKKRWG